MGVHHGLLAEHMDLAKELVRTCYETYAMHPTFLAPEITYFNMIQVTRGKSYHQSIRNGFFLYFFRLSCIFKKTDEENQMDMYVKSNDAHNLLRPEFIESIFYMWYLTGNKTYQDWGWQIFQVN